VAIRVLGNDWIAYHFAHDVALSGSNGAPVGFLRYPQAETTEGRLDSLDPDVEGDHAYKRLTQTDAEVPSVTAHSSWLAGPGRVDALP
jgi:hypothetical protein